MSPWKKSCFLLPDRQKLKKLFRGIDQVPIGEEGLGHQHDGSPLCTSLLINKRQMFIHCPCVIVAYYMLVYLPCDVPMFAICLVNCWLVTWLPLLDMLDLCLLDAMLLPYCIKMLTESLTNEFALASLSSRLTC